MKMDKSASFLHAIFYVFIFLRFVDCDRIADDDFQALCRGRCPIQNETGDHYDAGCENECKTDQCSKGCLLWRKALESSCQTVCNGTQSLLSQKELHCVMGCNEALDRYFEKLKDEIGTPPAPYLVADTLTATSLSLAWEGARYSETTRLVQWRYEERAGAWQYCRNQTWEPGGGVASVENLQPYTKYRFRVALLLSPHGEPVASEPSVVIGTLASGIPSSAPVIVRATAVDSKRISVSWKPGPFPNGPIHSYVLELAGEFTALKEDIPATKTTDFYMFQNLNSDSKYVLSISMRNAVGEGPSAIAEVTTPPEPSVKDALQPVLILGSKHRVIKQGADMVLDVPVVIYETSSLITGIGIHVSKNLLFVSDSEGYVSVTTLRESSRPERLLTPRDVTFKPSDLSVDWLNEHLYVLGEVARDEASLWQVARCSLDGRGLTVAVAGITSKPLHVEVDPYNGYLFWLIRGRDRGGLYRLDLADVSNGIKREVVPDVILEDPHLGAFVVDHVNFCILVPNHSKNTVYSVSLDGREVADLRSNTQQPLFQNVLSLAVANGLFYWTNGKEVLTEDYHEEYKTYFHNHYLESKNQSYIGVYVDLPTSQPVPVPVNPPVRVQAVLGGRVAKVSWQTPHVVGGQGKGAWQNWSYELRVKNEKTGEVKTWREIGNATFYAVEDLEENTPYAIKAAAYTSSGSGPWSREFRGKTLKAPPDGRYPSILWSADEGLLESDVTGEVVDTLISQENLKDEDGSDYHVSDVAWYRDILYLVTNSTTVQWYNLTSRRHGRLRNLESVGSIAVDWIGKKLYWSNPKQQLIIRGDLTGSGGEPLLILTVAKELNVDSEHAFIYWSTGHAVECARLNGESRRVYYPAELFSGKQVMGLTLDTDEWWAYWIVRSNEGSDLYRAPMARSDALPKSEIEPVKISSLKHPDVQGPLRYFGDHLLWLQDNRNAVIGDLAGQNAAVVSGIGLSGLHTVAVVDRNSRSRKEDEEISVVPEAIDESSIRVVGTHGSFNITWNAVSNVNFGQVFYDVKTEGGNEENHARIVDNEFAYAGAEDLPPYAELRVSLQAFTYWAASPRAVKLVRSPPSRPGPPSNPRAFVTAPRKAAIGRNDDPSLVITLRWNPPEEPNGIVTAYRVKYRVDSDDVDRFSEIYLEPDKLELTLEHVRKNGTYFFQIQAFTLAGEGKYAKTVEVDPTVESPVPTLIVATKDSIEIMDCDTGIRRILTSGDRPTDVALNSREGRLYWLNDAREILAMNLDGTGKIKIHALNGTGLSLAVDWVGRFLYWSELSRNRNSVSSVSRLDLSRFENGIVHVDEIVERSGRIEEIEVSPFAGVLYWIETSRGEDGGRLMRSRTDGFELRPLFSPERPNRLGRPCTCSENSRIGKTLTVDQTDPRDVVIIYSDERRGDAYRTESEGCECEPMVRSAKLPLPTSITTDHKYLYWSNETDDAVRVLDRNSEIRALSMRGVKKIAAVGSHLQPFPPAKCFTAGTKRCPTPAMIDNAPTWIDLRLARPEREPECENVSLPSVQYVIRFGPASASEGGRDSERPCANDASDCKSVVTYRRTARIESLAPFTSYVFTVSLRNYYGDPEGSGAAASAPVVFSTLPGAPSPPRNLTARVLTPDSVEIGWFSSDDSSKDETVSYQVHWRTEGIVAGVRQSGEKIVEDSSDSSFHRIELDKLMPGQIYLIWVRAHSKRGRAYSETEKIETKTFRRPDNVTLVRATPHSLRVEWTPPVDAIRRFRVEYRRYSGIPGEWMKADRATDERDPTADHYYYSVRDLQPKTFYKFRVVIEYEYDGGSVVRPPYVWPEDGDGFVFETLGDRPSPPGIPIVQQLRKDVYQVLWEKSRDNGAAIDCYALEGLIEKIWRKKRETLTGENSSSEFWNEIVSSENWILYYNGTDNYWIMNELSPSMKYVFRVKAKNKFGWSDFSETSRSFDFAEAAMLADQEELGIVLGTTVPLLCLSCLVIFTIFCCVTKKRDKEKKELQILTLTTAGRGPDVELATLRELPRRGNFIHNANILYSTSGGPPTDEEIALLPHIRRDQFKLTKFLGSGAFGEVYEGIARGLGPGLANPETRVAIKALRKGATEQEKSEFLKEAQLMSHFKHDHILQLLGVCLDNDPNYILMELMEGGDLLSYLRSNRHLANTGDSKVKLKDLLEMCVDVAKGCRYLEEMHFVHRDLACRNCLVSSADPSTRIVKIGDFGLARDIYKNDYYRKEGEGLLPVRWMAPESLVDGVFTSQSDVWAFGVLVWEIMTLGQQPYPARTNVEVLHYVRTGGRLGKPNNCSEDLHRLMMQCWSFHPESRPTFKYCLESLKELKERTTDATGNYLETRRETVGQEGEREEDGRVSNDGFHKNDENNHCSGFSTKLHSLDGESEYEVRDGSSSFSGELHGYLELIHEDDAIKESDGYEIPRPANDRFADRSRTFSTSSTTSETTGSVNVKGSTRSICFSTGSRGPEKV